MKLIGEETYFEKHNFNLSNNTFGKKENDFSGMVMYYDWNERFVNGFQYEKGKLTGEISTKQNQSASNERRAVCSTFYVDYYLNVCYSSDVSGWTCSDWTYTNTILYKDYLHLMSMLETDEQCADMVRSALTAIENEAESQVAGVVGTLQIAIVRINSAEICWVLSGDDFDLDLNNPLDPKLLTLGSDPTLVDSFSPVISCIATVALKLMNRQGKKHSIILLDEAPTLYIPKLDMIPATTRSNKISTIYMAQDFSQMVAGYGKEVADVVIANLNDQFYGRVGSAATAKHVSDLFGREEKETHSMSTGRSMHQKGQGLSESLSKSMQERLVVPPQDVTSLQVGEFIGMSVESQQPYFWSQVKVAKLPQGDYKIPAFTSGIAEVENFERIKREVAAIVQSYPKREMKQLKTKQSI